MAIQITIIGMDPLGQSMGLALKESGQPLTIVAHDRTHSNANQAAAIGAADRADWNLLSAIDGADLVIINEPVNQVRETLELIGPELRADAVITDTSPVKGVVLRWAEEILPPTVHFVGGNPLANPATPNKELFLNQRYAIIPLTSTPEAALRLVTNFVTLLGAEPLYIDKDEHDALQTAVMHLPMLLGTALIQLTTQSGSWREMASMASTPYAHVTALPSLDPAALAALFRLSRESLRHWLAAYRNELDVLETLIMEEDTDNALEARLTTLAEARMRWQHNIPNDLQASLYTAAVTEAKENNRITRLFSFGRRDRKQ
ncbi:MAG TPA: prephenate dehydrogenase [Ardenticatenaceae bacterium]|jgi:prephenate dehydrogenase